MNCELCNCELDESDPNVLIERTISIIEEQTHEIQTAVIETGLDVAIKTGVCHGCIGRMGLTRKDCRSCPCCRFPKFYNQCQYCGISI
jgi:hypothetical protein